MKSHRGNRTVVRRFSLIFVLMLAMAAVTFSFSAAQQEAGQSAGQTALNPSPASGGDAQPAQPAPPDQASAPQSAEQAPAPAAQAPNLELLTAPQPPDATASQPQTSWSPEYTALIQRTKTSLMAAHFTFLPVKALDPFVPFLVPETSPPEEQQNGGPMTPLQKMTMSEIERGLKAITWGDLGRKAVIEDSTGRGYIVGVGTPAGEHSGVISQILNDRLVIQQEIWDTKARKRFPQDFTIKLVKKTDNQ
jgi:type IV pilus assembly protein PilP